MPDPTHEPVLLEYHVAKGRPLDAFHVAMVLGAPLVTAAWLIGPAILYIYTHRVIGQPVVAASDATSMMMPWATTPLTIHAGFWFVPLGVALIFAFVAVIRAYSDRANPRCRRVFAVLTLFIGAGSLVLWTIPFWWLCSYIRGMGWTSSRAIGLAIGIAIYFAILAFLAWAIRPPSTRSLS